ncbi:CHAT domain-containing protein [Streptomyces erythrochromogenes]|uniref:CHAT domain-containing protein n=1 Tax=Streptomyces erythrochromogenes TaxID=285574 RepID=UPI0036B44B18
MLGKWLARVRTLRTAPPAGAQEIEAELVAGASGLLPDRRLDELIDSLEAVEDTDPGYGLAQHHLQLALAIRYRTRGAAADLERKLELATALVEWVPHDHLAHYLALAHRLFTLLMVYEKEGHREYLDEVISTGQRVLKADLPEPALRMMVTDCVSAALVNRFKQAGAHEDLDLGILLLRELCRSEAAAPDRPQYFSKLGLALLFRYEMSGDDAHLYEAVRYCRRGVRTAPDAYPERPAMLSNVGLVLVHAGRLNEGTRTGRAMLLEALDASRASVAEAPSGHPALPDLMNHLVGVLMTAGQLLSRVDLLDEAMSTAALIERKLPPGHPTRSACLTNQGTAARMRYDLTGDAADAERAVAAFRKAVGTTSGRPWARLDAAQKWGLMEAGRGRWDSALEGYRAAVDGLARLAHRELDRADQERQLARRAWAGVAADAAATALNAGRPELAVELLERGRAVVWAQSVGAPDSAGPVPRSLEELVSGWAVDGPAVLVNFSRFRSDALVVSAAGLTVVPLPGLVFEEAVDLLAGHLEVLLGAGSAPTDRTEREDRAGALLAWAWDTITEPVLTALGFGVQAGGTPLPRIWWCPTSLLTFVPLHASGRHDGTGGPGASVLDRAVSSYTPTLGALAGEAPVVPLPATGPRLLITAMRRTAGLQTLNLSETDRLTELFPGDRHTSLEDGEARGARVLAELGRHPYVHFACHGRQDLDDPARGGLVLHDGLLSVARLIEGARPGRLAVLAACQTATGGLVNADEAISLTAALQFAGWQDVVGSLWSASDEGISLVSEAVFAAVAALPDQNTLPPGVVARAVHAAVRQQRDDVEGELPSVWAPFLHMGR